MYERIHLDSCPFCGSPGEMIVHNDGMIYKAQCSENSMCLGTMIYKWFDTPEEAAEAWNMRSQK